MSNIYRGPSKDASYQVLAVSEEKIFSEINKSKTRMACYAMFVNGSGLNEHS
jgi:hypothetical protein